MTLAGSDLDETVAAISNAGGECITVEADVTQEADVARYVSEAISAYGRVDAFFNNAGIEGVRSALTDLDEDDFDRVIAVNLKGVWLGMKHVAPAMQESGGGAIVNTASVAGLSPTPGIIAYGASKHAVVGMTQVGSTGTRTQCAGQRRLPRPDRDQDDAQPRAPVRPRQPRGRPRRVRLSQPAGVATESRRRSRR